MLTYLKSTNNDKYSGYPVKVSFGELKSAQMDFCIIISDPPRTHPTHTVQYMTTVDVSERTKERESDGGGLCGGIVLFRLSAIFCRVLLC